MSPIFCHRFTDPSDDFLNNWLLTPSWDTLLTSMIEYSSGSSLRWFFPYLLDNPPLVVVQLPNSVQLFAISWTAAHQASLSLTIFWSLPKFMSIASVMPSSHLILWCPLLLLPSIFPSIRDFSSELAVRIRWPKYWFQLISPSKEFSGLISLKINWFELLAIQGPLRSLLQHHILKASILWHWGSRSQNHTWPVGRP